MSENVFHSEWNNPSSTSCITSGAKNRVTSKSLKHEKGQALVTPYTEERDLSSSIGSF